MKKNKIILVFLVLMCVTPIFCADWRTEELNYAKKALPDTVWTPDPWFVEHEYNNSKRISKIFVAFGKDVLYTNAPEWVGGNSGYLKFHYEIKRATEESYNKTGIYVWGEGFPENEYLFFGGFEEDGGEYSDGTECDSFAINLFPKGKPKLLYCNPDKSRSAQKYLNKSNIEMLDDIITE